MIPRRRKSILLVEDEALIALAEQLSLEKYGYDVVVAATGEEAVAVVREDSGVDLILMDINLGGGLDGTEAAEIILRERELPVVFLSSHVEPEVVAKTEAITSYGYVVKNTGITVLDASIKMAFKLFEAKMKERSQQEALRKSEEQYRAIFNSAVEGIFQTTEAGRYRTVNPAFALMFGYDSPEEMQETVTDIGAQLYVDPQDRIRLIKQMKASGGAVRNFEAPLFRKDGSPFWVSINARLIDTGGPDTPQIEGTCMDVTERRRVAQALRESDRKLNEINNIMAGVLDHTHMKAVFLDPAFNFVWVNRAYAETCGYDPSFFPGKNHFDLFPSEENQAIFQRVVDTGEPFVIEAKAFLFPDQPERGLTWWDWSLVPVKDDGGRVVGLVFTLAEVTSRVRAEQQVQQGAELLQTIIDNALCLVYAKDLGGRFILASQSLAHFFDRSREELIGKTSHDFLPKETADQHRANDLEVMQRQAAFCVEETVETPEGLRTYFSTKFPLWDKERNLYAVCGASVDITSLKQAEEALRLSHHRYQQLVEHARDGIFTLDADPEGHFVFVNAGICEILGYTGEELLHRSILDTYPDELRDEGRRRLAALQRKGGIQFERTMRRKDGSFVTVEASGWKSEEGCLQAIVRDVTERKRAEEALRRQLEEKEILLRETHHRIKNNLASVASLLSLQASNVANPEAAEALKGALGRVGSMARLYDRMLVAGDYREAAVGPYLADLADSVVAIFSGTTQIAVHKKFDEFSLGSRTLFALGIIANELLTNTIKHAFAGRTSGVVGISAENVGGRVTLSVWDDGQHLPSGFDAASSPGFGLKLVGMICNQIGAQLTVENRDGTRVVVEFDAPSLASPVENNRPPPPK